MLISLNKRFVFLQMPKCASSSVEQALHGYCQITATGAPGLRHTTYRKYERYIVPYMARAIEDRQLESICLMREPVSWLASWWKYRGREKLQQPTARRRAHSTLHVSFDEFVGAFLQDEPPPYAKIGRQYHFVLDANGEVGVERIFAYEDLDRFLAYMSEKVGEPVRLSEVNKSPESRSSGAAELEPATLKRLQKALKEDFELYERVVAAGGERLVKRRRRPVEEREARDARRRKRRARRKGADTAE